MRRPLCCICLLLVAVTALRCRLTGNALHRGMEDSSLEQRQITLIGQVDQKQSDRYFLSSIQIINQNQQAAESQHTYPYYSTAAYEQETGQAVRSEELAGSIVMEKGEEQELALGSVVLVQGTFRMYSSATNPGEFDSRQYYLSIGVWGQMKGGSILEWREAGWGEGRIWYALKEALYQLKERFLERLQRIFPEKEASIMGTMLLGERSSLDPELKELYQRNGIIHILSISGLHITIIGMGVYHMLRRMGMPGWLAGLLGGGLLCCYGILTGMGISACRAIGMYLLRMFSIAVGRTYDMLTALAVMAVMLSWGNPLVLGHAGFLLSFGSLFGIGVVYPIWQRGMERWLEERSRFEGGGAVCDVGNHGVRETLHSVGKWLRGALSASAAITLTTLPIQLWFYYEVPVYSMLLNLLVLPFMEVVVLSGLCAMLVPGLGIVGTADCLILQGYEALCHAFESLPFHTWNPGQPALWQVVGYYVILAGVCLWVRYGRRKNGGVMVGGVKTERRKVDVLGADGMKFDGLRAEGMKVDGLRAEGMKVDGMRAGGMKVDGMRAGGLRVDDWKVGGVIVGGVLVGIILLGISLPGRDRVTFLDVGQGDGICIRSAAGGVYLFDGGSSSRQKLGEYVLLPYLKHQGIRRVEALLISHPDADHYSGALELLQMGREEGIEIGCVILPDVAEKEGESWQELLAAVGEYYGSGADSISSRSELIRQGKLRYLSEGQVLQGRGINMTCLHPPASYENEDSNAVSLCFYVKFSHSEGSLLLTGDVEGDGEELLLQTLAEQDIESATILKVAHHGSRYSTPQELLQQITPQLAIISCGASNRYGHPHTDLLERLETAHIPTLQTPHTGAITLTFWRDTVKVTSYR